MKLANTNKIGIIGTGIIGASNALLFTGSGFKTIVYGINDAETAAGLKNYRSFCKDLIDASLITEEQTNRCERLLSFTSDYNDLADVDVVFESAIENLEIKHSIYQKIESYCKNIKAIASTTSAISAEELAKGLKNMELLVVAHPWNPPHLVPLVEVVKSRHTSDQAVQSVVDILKSAGRAPIVLKKDAPGFIANRLHHALFREAAYIVEQGIATAEDVDIALKTSFTPRYTSVGIFEHFDYCGLDMIMSIHKNLYPSLCNAAAPQDIVRIPYEAGNLGYKTGKGMLDWSDIDINSFRKKGSQPYLKFFNLNLPDETGK